MCFCSFSCGWLTINLGNGTTYVPVHGCRTEWLWGSLGKPRYNLATVHHIMSPTLTSDLLSACGDMMWYTVANLYRRIPKDPQNHLILCPWKKEKHVECILTVSFIGHVSLELLGLHLFFSPLARSSTAGGQNSAALSVVMPDYQVGHLVILHPNPMHHVNHIPNGSFHDKCFRYVYEI